MAMADTTQLDPGLIPQQVLPDQIPVIDLAPFRHGTLAEKAQVAAKIGAACRNTGFFYIVNHGVPPELVADVYAQAKRFFALPPAQKAQIAIEKSPCHRGWFQVGGENLDPRKQTQNGDLKEGIKIGNDLPPTHPLVLANTPLHGPNQWPDLPGWRAVMQNYFSAMESLGRELLHSFALALGLTETYFDRWLSTPMTTLGPLHYPPQRGHITEAQLGAGAHTDFGCLTILAQDDTGGLQVRGKSGAWLAAPPIPGSFVVNIGDMMERWTNGVFASTLHRVVNASGRERYSIPFFFDPDFATPVECLPTCLAPGETPKYPPTTAGRHLLDKINESFAYHQEKQGP
ncbi:2OG-Fe(II) oxygenase [Acidocella aquatica]|uniref:2OG-Fe(II) oxygenase n=2 Tax=Acidocella aquatica TaxID=1922313 RepID=A0ABQ6AC68_9PROT|nr:2OG-Fe(II) oxygenase [Acidocella aquatica]